MKVEGYLENYIRKQIYEIPNIINRQTSTEDNMKFNKRDDYYKIQQRIDDFTEKRNSKRFFVLPGLRGVGKTTLLLQAYEYLLKEKNLSPKDILYISFEEINSLGQTNIKEIIEIYLEKIHNTTPALLDKKVYIFIDEAHYDENWALNGKVIYDKSPFIFMIFTGSSSLHLSYNADAARRLKVYNVLPISYSQHLKLKYNYHTDISKDLTDLIFKGKVEKCQEKESRIQDDLMNMTDYQMNDWDRYFKYGAFPSTLYENYEHDIIGDLWSIISKIVTQDMVNIFDINRNTQNNIYRTLAFLASQKPGDISQGKIAAHLSCSKGTVNSMFNILEQTQLIFHYESYGGSGRRIKKSWKYYLATPSLKHSLNEKFGNTLRDQSDYEGVLIENLIATSLFNLSNNPDFHIFNTYYDSGKEGVDFLVQKTFETPIPIEVGRGKKDNRQIKKAMNKFDAEYGILISNKEKGIEKRNDIIYVSPKTFSLL